MCIGPLQFSSLRPKTQKHKEILCRFDRGAPQVEPQIVQGTPFLQFSERRPPLRIVFNSAECFYYRRQGHGKSVDDRKEITFKEADGDQ